MIVILLVAVVLAWVIGDLKDVLVILGVVIFNALLGFPFALIGVLSRQVVAVHWPPDQSVFTTTALPEISICHTFAALVADVSYILTDGLWYLFFCWAQELYFRESRFQPIAPDAHGATILLLIVVALFPSTRDRLPLVTIRPEISTLGFHTRYATN